MLIYKLPQLGYNKDTDIHERTDSMNKKTLLSLFILIAIVLSLSLIACNDKKAPVETSGEEQTETFVETEPETLYAPPTNLPDELPESSSRTMSFLTRGGGGGDEWTVEDIYIEEDSADTIDHAIYERNQALYEKYGVEVSEYQVDVNGIYQYLYSAIAGGEAFDAVDMNLMDSFSAASNGLLLDLETELPHLDLNNPWWDQGTREDFSIKNRLYYTCSDINLMAYKATWVAVYNKSIMSNLGYKDSYIYDLVRDGKWTLDEYYNIIKTFTKDLNNDNKMTSVDQYGTSLQGSGPDGFIICSGFRYCSKNEDDELVFNELDDKGIDMLNKVVKVASNAVAYNSHNTQQNDQIGADTENGRTMFSEGRSLFFTEALNTVDMFRDNESDFGIVPLPKYDEEGEYTSFVHHWAGSAISVPINAPDVEKTGIVLDYMSYLSAEIVTPAYFNMVVEGKYMRDQDSYEMIEDYIMANRVFDLVMANRINGLPDTIVTAINNNMSNFASIYKRSTKAITTKLQEYNEAFE